MASTDEHTAFMAGGVRWMPKDAVDEPAPEVDLSAISDEEAAAIEAALARRKGKP